MLKVYAAKWCPHCTLTTDYLNENRIDFEYIDIERQPDEVVQQVIDVNGGEDWVVPTLEYNGKWREGREFDSSELERDLKHMGVTPR